MYFTNVHLKADSDLADHINSALEEDGLRFDGKIAVRHLLELLATEVGPDDFRSHVTNPLEGLRVVPYYGCQTVRPRKADEEVEQPQFFEAILAAAGATPVDFPYKLRCCGGSLLITNRHAALSLVRDLLHAARRCGGAIIATACPMCQVNLECYQQQVNQEFGTDFSTPVVYFTQLLGLALGVPPRRLEIGKELVSLAPISPFAEKLAHQAA
jgi:heterodisulfide reductase subunit B